MAKLSDLGSFYSFIMATTPVKRVRGEEGDAAPSKRTRKDPVCPICTGIVSKPLQEKLKIDLAALRAEQKEWEDMMMGPPSTARWLLLESIFKHIDAE